MKCACGKVLGGLLITAICSSLYAMPAFCQETVLINPDTVEALKNAETPEVYGLNSINGVVSRPQIKEIEVRPDQIFTGMPEEGMTLGSLADSLLTNYNVDCWELYTGAGTFFCIDDITLTICLEDSFQWYDEYIEQFENGHGEAAKAEFDEKMNSVMIYPSGGPKGEIVYVQSNARFETTQEEEDNMIDHAVQCFRDANAQVQLEILSAQQ